MVADRKLAAVYVPWKTFWNSLNQLKNGVPGQIDRTVFPGMAGALQSQLFSGYKFLGLMDDAGKPTDLLNRLAVAEDDQRRILVAQILRERYPKIFDLNLKQATLAQVSDVFSDSYNVGGDTKDRALRFFLVAAEFAGIELSSFIKGAKRTTRRARNNGAQSGRQQRATGFDDDEEDAEEQPPAGGTSKTIQLKSGGTVTVSASLDVFSLKPEDRNFVFELIDKLNAYEAS